MGGGAVDVPLRMIGQGYYDSLERVCASLGVPTTRATVDCSFADFGKPAHLRYSASRVANFLELRGRWAPARRLDAALRDARDGDGARSWGAWKADRGLDAASNACVRALDGQLSWVLSCSKRTLEHFPAGPILAYARGLGLGLAGCLLARGSRDVVRVRPSVAALEAALAHGSELALGADVRNVGPDRAVGGRGPFDAVVLAVPPGALAAALDVDAVLPPGDRDLFAGFASETNRIVLHADARLMPTDRRDWRALNVTGGDGDGGAAMLTVWLNRYYPEHAFDGDVFQTWNPHVEPEADRRLSPDLRLPRVVQSWPETPKIQARVAELQGVGGFYFAGAHAVPGMGLLEQACQAGEAAAARVLADLAA